MSGEIEQAEGVGSGIVLLIDKVDKGAFSGRREGIVVDNGRFVTD